MGRKPYVLHLAWEVMGLRLRFVGLGANMKILCRIRAVVATGRQEKAACQQESGRG
jgi:hypothetical protein